MTDFSLAYFLAAIGFFIYGLRLTESNLRRALGDRFRTQIDALTQNRFFAFLLGATMTMVFQSSTATTVMLVGLAGVGALTVRQAAPVVLGADVGTTLLVLLLASLVSFNLLNLALAILLIGFASTLFLKDHAKRPYAQAFLGIGFICYGLSLIASSNVFLRESPLVQAMVEALLGQPLVSLAFALFLTGLLQSSAAVLGILVSLAAGGLLTLEGAIPFVLGANLGSTVGSLLAGLSSKAEGKRVALIHVGLKAIGVIVAFPFIAVIARGIEAILDSPPYQVAATHVGLNATIAVVCLPLTHKIAGLVSAWVTDDPPEKVFGPKYLDEKVLNSPAIAFANVQREILRMAEIAQDMFARCLRAFEEGGEETIRKLEDRDDQVDLLNRRIMLYLSKINQAELSDAQAQRELELLTLTNNLESVGDVIDKNVMELAKKRRRLGHVFSQEGWKDIVELHRLVGENFRLAVSAFITGDVNLGHKLLRHKRYVGELEQEFNQKHLMRLHQGLSESLDTSSIHLDLLGHLRRINSVICKTAYPVLDQRLKSEADL